VLKSQTGLQLWKIWTQIVEINSAWETIRKNIKISAQESLGYFELKMKDAPNY
jgi:hypothetical protein